MEPYYHFHDLLGLLHIGSKNGAPSSLLTSERVLEVLREKLNWNLECEPCRLNHHVTTGVVQWSLTGPNRAFNKVRDCITPPHLKGGDITVFLNYLWYLLQITYTSITFQTIPWCFNLLICISTISAHYENQPAVKGTQPKLGNPSQWAPNLFVRLCGNVVQNLKIKVKKTWC